MTLPKVDPNVTTRWVSWFRALDGKKLRALKQLVVIQHQDDPIAVVIPYRMYLELQAQLDLGKAQGRIVARPNPSVAFDGPLSGAAMPVPGGTHSRACVHCEQPSEQSICASCFMGGHRNGACTVCAPAVESEREV